MKYLSILAVLTLAGCGHFTNLKYVNIDNTTINNYVGNPCAFYLNDHCLYMKPQARNPNNPYPPK